MKEYFEGIYLKEQILKSIWNQIYSIDFPAFIVNTSSVHIIHFFVISGVVFMTGWNLSDYVHINVPDLIIKYYAFFLVK